MAAAPDRRGHCGSVSPMPPQADRAAPSTHVPPIGGSMRSVEIADVPFGPSPDTKKLRAYASRLMDFALKAVGDGDAGFAECLAVRALECLDQAQAVEVERELVPSADLLRATLLRVHDSSWGSPVNRVSVSECAQCGAGMIAPTWSEHPPITAFGTCGPARPADINSKTRSVYPRKNWQTPSSLCAVAPAASQFAAIRCASRGSVQSFSHIWFIEADGPAAITGRPRPEVHSTGAQA